LWSPSPQVKVNAGNQWHLVCQIIFHVTFYHQLAGLWRVEPTSAWKSLEMPHFLSTVDIYLSCHWCMNAYYNGLLCSAVCTSIQEWPISCVIGTSLGYCVGLLISSLLLLHRLQTGRKSKSF